jgi:bifunctional non-homologous end joining protein LigD
VAGVRLSNPGRVLFPEEGLTKQGLAEFYEHIADWVLPHVVDRPLSLVRCPRGRQHTCFFQKHLTESMPDALRGVDIMEKDETTVYVAIDDLQGLISLVQMGVLEIHPWGSRTDQVERPDRLVFDLDPAEDVNWNRVIAAAKEVRQRLEEIGLESFVRTSGGKGLHVVVPLRRRAGWDETKDFAHALALEMTRQSPERYVSTVSKAKRKGKILVDYLRNGRGATAVASYSTRARAGAPVATPLRWNELSAKITAAHFTVANLPKRLASLRGDPWEGFFSPRQSLTQTMVRDARKQLRP